ncbi:MAG: hypothetical protein QG629_620 [Patescibacteria group bacterium]|nr:NUDIX domain-containing protein [Candidatus Saccharibacteria bacterium]MDQ5963538.1 hypothetical protein [Patescibacteria group bacterium]
MEDQEEILDLVNKNDEVIGTIRRSEIHTLDDLQHGFIRAVDMFIVNDEGKVWVPRRTADKQIAPNGLDFSVGGHVSSGDDYLETCIREAAEEVNLHIRPDELEFVKSYTPNSIQYFRKVYVYRSNDTPDFNPHDFTEAHWLTPDEAIARLDAGELAKSSLRPTLLDLKDYLQK